MAPTETPATRSTANRLLDAGEQLFGERGYEATSLRSVTERAGANIAAVNYHFRSKEGLLGAVVARAMEPVNIERDRRLTALYSETNNPTVVQVVRAFVESALDPRSDRVPHRASLGRFIATVLLDPSPKIRQLFADVVDPVEGRYLDALRRALPDQDPDTVLIGYTNMLGLIALHQAGTFTGLLLRAGHPAEGRVVPSASTEQLIAFLVAGLTATPQDTPA